MVPGAPNTFYDAMTRLSERIIASGQQRTRRQLLHRIVFPLQDSMKPAEYLAKEHV